LYIKINGSKVAYNGQASDLAQAGWQLWNIDLTTLSVNLQSVSTLAIGIDGNGASGTLYFDDIGLLRAPLVSLLTIAPLTTLEAETAPGDPSTLVSIRKINGVDASALIVGTTTADLEIHAANPAVDADNLDLTNYASLDDSTVIQTIFGQPVTTIFMMERGANDSGFFQALDTNGNPVGQTVPFTAADFQLPTSGLKIAGQNAGGIAIESDVPIGGLMILPPEGGVHTIDPASISAVPAP
jgi:hypothetical protein